MKKPKWVIKKEKDEKTVQKKTYWIFGLHAVRDALVNQNRKKFRLMMTKNAAAKLSESISIAGLTPEIFDARQFKPPIDKNSVVRTKVGYLDAVNIYDQGRMPP